VSTAVPEVERYPALVRVARDGAAFVTAIEQALADTTPRAWRSEQMASETWAARVAGLARHVDDISEQKRQL